MESAKAYRDSKAVHDSVIQAQYYEDLAKLRTQREVDKLELQSRKLELEAEKSRVRSWIFGSGAIILLLLCGVLGFLGLFPSPLWSPFENCKRKSGGSGSFEVCLSCQYEP